MSPALLLALVLLATFGAASLGLSGLLAVMWRVGLKRLPATSLDLLGLRLMPAVGALLIAVAVVLPAFRSFEPPRQHEATGPWLLALAAFAAVSVAHGGWRGWRACRAARTLLKRCRASQADAGAEGRAVYLMDGTEPLVAVIGAWRPRIIAAESVRAACNGEEFREVLAHEAAHLAARDNLKLLLLTAVPDVLRWTPLGAALTARWRAAAECEADRRATGADRERRLALASALVKVARLLGDHQPPRPALGMPVAADDVPARVRALLAPPGRPARSGIALILAGGALLIPLLALPGYGVLHELIERLVAL